MPTFALRALMALASVLFLLQPLAAQDLPSGTITLVVGNGAGGIADVTARMYAEVLSRNIGHPVVVENRPAGGGAVAALSVKNAAADGRTLLLYPGAQLAAMPILQNSRYDPLKDFAPVATLFDLLNFIAVPPRFPANTIAELLAYWKRSPNGLRVGAAGFGSPAHFNSVILSLDNSLPVTMVQYGGSAPLMPDLITARIDMAMISYIVAQPFLPGHKIKLLAQDGATRWSGMPDVPTMVESGQLRKKASSWFAVSAPAGTPKPIIDRLNSEFIKASKEPQLAAQLQANGVLTRTTSPQELGRLLSAEIDIVRPLAKSLRMAPE